MKTKALKCCYGLPVAETDHMMTDKLSPTGHSNKISTVQFAIKLCRTDPRLSCSLSTLNPRVDIDKTSFPSVRLFTVEIWLD